MTRIRAEPAQIRIHHYQAQATQQTTVPSRYCILIYILSSLLGPPLYCLLKPVLWIRIQIGYVFSNFLDLGPYSEFGSGSTQVITDKLEATGVTLKTKIVHSEI